MIPSQKNLSILILDRNPTSLVVLQKLLNVEGYEVRVETNSDRALKQIHLSPPDLILLDVILDDTDGFQVCSQLKTNFVTAKIPIVFLTTANEIENKIKGLTLGAVDYITKPFQVEEVVARINNHLKSSCLTLLLEDKNRSLKETNIDFENKLQEQTIVSRQSQQYLEQITANIESVFWLKSTENDRFIYISPALEKIWGLSVEQLYTNPQKWIETIHPDDLAKVLNALPDRIKGKYNIVYRIVNCENQIRWIHEQTHVITNERGEVYRIAGIAEDITGQRQVYNQLNLKRQAVWASNNGMIIIDVRLPGYPIIFVNPAFESMTGYSLGEVIGKNCLFFVARDNNKIALKKLKSCLKKGENCTVNLRNYHRDGSVFWHELNISPIRNEHEQLTHFIIVQTDITKRVQAEKDLKQQLAAVESAIDGIAILDRENRHIYTNQSYLKMFGYREQKHLLGKTLKTLYTNQEWQQLKQNVFPSLKNNGNWQGEAVVKRKDGSTFIKEVSFTKIKDIGLVCVCRNISARKRAEKKLKKSLEEKELLLREIHHRVKNNLLVVSGLLDLQISYVEDDYPQIIKIFEECQKRIYSMALIHEKLYQSKNLAKIDFSEYIETLVEQLIYSFNLETDRIKLEFKLESVFLNIETATPCGLIVSELIANIIEHAFPENMPGKILVSLTQTFDRFKLVIKDNGVGLPEQFDFSDTETLGLKLVKLLTKQIKGELIIVEENGTKFELIFAELQYTKRV